MNSPDKKSKSHISKNVIAEEDESIGSKRSKKTIKSIISNPDKKSIKSDNKEKNVKTVNDIISEKSAQCGACGGGGFLSNFMGYIKFWEKNKKNEEKIEEMYIDL